MSLSRTNSPLNSTNTTTCHILAHPSCTYEYCHMTLEKLKKPSLKKLRVNQQLQRLFQNESILGVQPLNTGIESPSHRQGTFRVPHDYPSTLLNITDLAQQYSRINFHNMCTRRPQTIQTSGNYSANICR
jgi:hypothetical protein